MNKPTLLQRLGQESTWRGLIATAAALGLTIEPALQNAIIGAALGLIGLINIFKKD